jgi:L-threonylcarbamoyladenylate synthase
MIKQYSQEVLLQAVSLLQHEEIVAFPTETVYGLGGLITSEKALNKIYDVKKRPRTNPLIVHIHDVGLIDTVAYIDTSKITQRLDRLKQFFPGPLTLLLKKKEEISRTVTAHQNTVCVRIPSHLIAQELLKEVKTPVAAPSANKYTHISPTKALHVAESLGQEALPLTIDAGDAVLGLESTILSLIGDVPSILRPGWITREELQMALREEVLLRVDLKKEYEVSKKDISCDSLQRVPGSMKKHYSPKTPLILIEDFLRSKEKYHRKNIAFLSFFDRQFEEEKLFEGTFIKHKIQISHNCNTKEVATQLYAALHKLEEADCDVIVVDTCERIGIGEAIMDRLVKARGI